MNRLNINNVKERLVDLPEKVKAGKERELNWNDFESDPFELGNGTFANVFKAKLKSNQEIYAVKCIEKNKIKKANLVNQVNLELSITYSLDHPNIIKLVNHWEDDKNINLVIEFAAGGQLIDKLKEQGRFDEKTVIFYMKQILDAFEYMQSREPKVIHRDIKPENILLDAKGFFFFYTSI